MEDLISGIGVPAIVVILLLREILPALKSNNNDKDNKNDNREISRSEFNELKKGVQYKDTCSEIVKRMDGRFDTIDTGIQDLKRLVKNGNK